ncbi:hypothetical protein OAM01_02730, partial [bacterium]|nr:hypothetical protein [bacterium]
SRDSEGNQTGAWISFFGSSELKDLSFENNQLQFTQTRRGRNGETTSKFTGTIEEGKLKGTLKSDQGESEITGERAPRASRASGTWAMKIKAGEREYTGTLNIKNDASGEMSGEWSSQRGKAKVDDLSYSRGELAFKRTIKTEDNEWVMAFTGNIRGNTLTGVAKSERGEAEVTGEKVGGAAIGTWNLTITSERGPRNQRLRVHSDMSGLYGSTAVDKVSLDGNKVSFAATVEFGDREFTSDFAGVIDGDSITGEITSGQGSRKVTGKKVVRNFRRTR